MGTYFTSTFLLDSLSMFPVMFYSKTNNYKTEFVWKYTYATGLNRGLYKYLTAQDTHFSPNSTKHCKNLPPSNPSPQYKNISIFLSLVLSKFIPKLDIAMSWQQLNFQFFPPDNTCFWNFIFFFYWKKNSSQVHFLQILPSPSSEITI